MSYILGLVAAFIFGLVTRTFFFPNSMQQNEQKNRSVERKLIVDLLEMLGEQQRIEKVVDQEVVELNVLKKLYFLRAATPIDLTIYMHTGDIEGVKRILQSLQRKRYVTFKKIKSGYEEEIYQVSNLGKTLGSPE